MLPKPFGSILRLLPKPVFVVVKELDKKYPEFTREPKNIQLGLAADGFNIFGNMSLLHSIWPVVMTTYNLPLWLYTKDSCKMLTLLIPSPNAHGKNIDLFLRLLVDELKKLWDEWVVVHDAALKTLFGMQAVLLMIINDFPARSTSLSD